MLDINDIQEGQNIKLKDLQNIIMDQTTLDLLIYLLKLSNQFMVKPLFKQAQYALNSGTRSRRARRASGSSGARSRASCRPCSPRRTRSSSIRS